MVNSQSDLFNNQEEKKSKKKETEQKPSWMVKEEKELARCTFRPNTAKPSLKLPSGKPSVVVGYKETVDRMR